MELFQTMSNFNCNTNPQFIPMRFFRFLFSYSKLEGKYIQKLPKRFEVSFWAVCTYPQNYPQRMFLIFKSGEKV